MYAVTATDGSNPSYAAYCYPDGDRVRHRHMRTCLGDLFSVSWMENAEAATSDISTQTFQDEF